MTQGTLQIIQAHLRTGGSLRLFLDYDGTLVPIARTPEEARPDAALLELLARLASTSQIQLMILSGRSLASLQAMLPMPGIMLAGTYGIEIQTPDSQVVTRLERKQIRPKIAKIKSAWRKLIAKRSGFWLEDKGLSIALHARFANSQERAVIVLSAQVIARMINRFSNFRILADVDFLEVAPALAHKGKTVEWLLSQNPLNKELLVYFGDDDKDEEAFEVVQRLGGYTVLVGNPRRSIKANEHLPSPDTVHQWLNVFCSAVSERSDISTQEA